jgi:hypothetical protein
MRIADNNLRAEQNVDSILKKYFLPMQYARGV